MNTLKIYFQKLKQNWPGIVAILALFLGGSSTYSSFIEIENLEISRENKRMQNLIPKGELKAYQVDVLYTVERKIETPGLPEQTELIKIFYQDMYVVCPTVPYPSFLEAYYEAPLSYYKPEKVVNIREVGIVRETPEDAPVQVIEDSSETE